MAKSFISKITGRYNSKNKQKKNKQTNAEDEVQTTEHTAIKQAPIIVENDDVLDSEMDDNEDVYDAPIEIPANHDRMRGRQSVSAEAYGQWNVPKKFTPPVYVKTQEQTERINKALSESFIFSALDNEEIETIVAAFQEVKAHADQIIIQEGDDGDKLYLIETGSVDVYKTDKETQQHKPLCVLTTGDIFGELALMYNAPRAATVKATCDTFMWSLDRESFNNIVRDATIRKREMYEGFLKEVTLLEEMDNYERSKIADALKKHVYTRGDIIIKEGDIGETFFILIDGEAEAIKQSQTVMKYKKGDFFGELALIKNQPRAATVQAVTSCTVVYLDRNSFKRLLGPVENILMRNVVHYKQTMEELGMDIQYLS